ncbi:uncharacterized protein LOC111369281 [Olea europaea var. sylvestris]|uniref:uncharacterized protein LOC111369281 n=1 Tax=Olea europaea var. sylvestris TaxID=158386 RepID=UPI000C1D04FA|nr:uncharacterized protein LOC111369281 [Olea europaea var. sylvestris]
MTALMNGNRNRAFKMSLSENPPESMHDLLKKGDKYVDAEEAEKVTKNLKEGWEVESHKRKARDELRPANQNRPMSEQMVKKASQYRPARHKREESRAFTPLNTPRAKLLVEIRDMKKLEWSRPMVTLVGKRNQGRYYHFHNDHGHDTEECLQLKEEIEPLLGWGLLGKYVKDNRGKRVSMRGRFTLGKEKLRPHSRDLLYPKEGKVQPEHFGEEDLVGVAHPHDDALVIVGDIADFDVKKVLVDGGSAANVLTCDAFLGLRVPPDKLKIVNTRLQGFGGATVIPEGTVELPVMRGTYPTIVVIMVSFLVVKTPIAYNAIYGRPLLNTAEVIPSTYHQVLKFPTSRGVGCV